MILTVKDDETFKTFFKRVRRIQKRLQEPVLMEWNDVLKKSGD